MDDGDSCYDATSLVEPRRSRLIPKWLQKRPKFPSLRTDNPYLNIEQDDFAEREIYNPIVDGGQLWPHESADDWAVPATDSAQNNNATVKRVHSESHSSVELEWENEEGMPKPTPTELPGARTSGDHQERMSIASVTSHHSHVSNTSNDLEWDEDFNLQGFHEIKQVDFDTEQLIAEIDKMTEKALRETEPVDTSLPPFESLGSMASM